MSLRSSHKFIERYFEYSTFFEYLTRIPDRRRGFQNEIYVFLCSFMNSHGFYVNYPNYPDYSSNSNNSELFPRAIQLIKLN